MSRDGVLGAALAALAVGYYRAAATIPASGLADAVGPGGLPMAYAGVLGFLSVLLMLRGWRTVGGEAPTVAPRTLARVGGLLAIGIAYIVIVPRVGYPVALAGLLIGTTYYQGGRLNGQVVVVGVAGAAVLWTVFVAVLGIDHPTGVWLERLIGQP